MTGFCDSIKIIVGLNVMMDADCLAYCLPHSKHSKILKNKETLIFIIRFLSNNSIENVSI